MTPMKRRPRRLLPSVEGLEGRVVLSTIVSPPPLHAAVSAPGMRYLALEGTIRVKFHEQVPTFMDAPTNDYLLGSGVVSPLGRSSVSGLISTDFGQIGTSAVRLTNARGSLVVFLGSVVGSGQSGPDSVAFDFHIKLGQGAYARTVGIGTVNVSSDGTTYSLTFHGTPRTV